MIIELLLAPFFGFIRFLINLLPNTPAINLTLANLIYFVKKGLYFTDKFVFFTCLTVVVTFTTIQLAWAILEWIYKKIPGVN